MANRMFRKAAFQILIISLGVLMTAGDTTSATLRAGAARTDITPPVGVWLSGYGARKEPSSAVADPLYAKALVLDDGQSRIAIVSADLLWLPLEITRQVRKRVQNETGIPADHIMVCGTHTHWGPKIDRPAAAWPDAAESRISDDYVDVLTDKITRCVIEAHNKSAGATAAAGNMNPVRLNRKRFRHEIGTALAGEVLRRLQTVATKGQANLRGMTRPITFDLKPASPENAEQAPGKLNTEVQLLAIGDIYILGLPSEVLVEIGFAIKEKAGLEKLFVVSIANDACGYICHKEAYEQGGYESTSATRLAPGAGEHLIEEALALIASMKKE